MRTIRKPLLSVLSLTALTAACLNASAPSVPAQVPTAVASPPQPASATRTESPRYLNIGDPAPVLQSAKWLKGTPVPKFERGKLYVVEFWATWCGPCKENIPHLTEMAKKYKDRVSIIGVDIWENAKPGVGDPMARVATFVKEKGTVMDYIVAADGPEETIANTWMKPAGEQGIPCSFIVDKEGKIVWIGHPATMESVLEKVVAGTYDPAPVKEARETHLQLLRPVEEAMAARDYPAAVGLIEKAVAKQPSLFYSLAYPYLTALFHSDEKKGMAVAHKILAETDAEGKPLPGAYQMVGSLLATEPNLSPASYRFGTEVLDEALQKWPKDYMYLMMKASIFFHQGDKAEALRLAKGALSAAQSSTQKSPEAIALIQKYIAQYEEANR
jgi:thiol-disulfide isomerase/thioredoxin